MNVQYSEISTREVVTIGDLVQRALAYSINKRTNKALGVRAVYARVDPKTRWITVSTNRAKPLDFVPC
jgi:hypothetical protein